MTPLLVVELTCEVVGAVGECSGQHILNDPRRRPDHLRNVSFIGAARQIYLPGLQPLDLKIVIYGAI